MIFLQPPGGGRTEKYMKYGCIGEHLKHSFSKEIHNALADYDYEIREVERGALDAFAEAKDFLAINVTIPYKELIMPHLYYIDEHAAAIGAVNTVVNRGGKLYGYNTDFYGMSMLFSHAGIKVCGKKVAILGTGGTSKTAREVAKALLAREILTVSRRRGEGAVSYEDLYNLHSDTEIIINTTPVGMFPNILDKPVDLSSFKNLSGVIDAVYNPLRTPLISQAISMGIPAEGGLYMLVAQAVRASEIFLDKKYPPDALDKVYKKIFLEKENIVLVGMPASGKSTVGAMLAKLLNRDLVDTDALIVESEGVSIPDIFASRGEKYFRDRESEAVLAASALTSVIIATGGGAILREENVKMLKENGRLYFIDRPLCDLVPTSDRPLSSDRDAIEKRYNERYDIYRQVSDVRIDADCNAKEVTNRISEDFLK